MKDDNISGFRGGKKPAFDKDQMESLFEKDLYEWYKEAQQKEFDQIADFILRQFCNELSQIPPFKASLYAMVSGYGDDFVRKNFNFAIERAINLTRAALDYVYGSGKAKVDNNKTD